MKRLISATLSFAYLLAFPVVGSAQDCSSWTDFDLRGTYTMSGSGFIDMSKLLPGMGLPSGMIPMTWVGAQTYDGHGKGTGWVSFNAGGNHMNAQLDQTYAVQPDCSVKASFSMRVKELGVTVGPFPRMMVIVWKPGALELHMILGDASPSKAPGVGLDLGVAYRISMQGAE